MQLGSTVVELPLDRRYIAEARGPLAQPAVDPLLADQVAERLLDDPEVARDLRDRAALVDHERRGISPELFRVATAPPFARRRRARRGPDGVTRYLLQPRQSWTVVIPDAHPSYISWARYEDNLARLAECAQPRGEDRRASPPREAPPCCRASSRADAAASA